MSIQIWFIPSPTIPWYSGVEIVKAMVFQWSHTVVRELVCKQGRAPKNWCLWTVVLEKTPESPLDIKPVNLMGNQPWILIKRTDTEAEAPVFWSSDANSWLIGKVPSAGKDWGQKEKGVLEDEMAGWRHQCNEHEINGLYFPGTSQWSCTVVRAAP